jgi:hypothetical protein
MDKVWNYFKDKKLSPPVIAGIMGNMQAENSAFNPKVVEGGWGFPSEMDTIPPNKGPQGQPGYGLVQWTSPNRKQGLQDIANAEHLPVYDLGLQLDYVWQELTGPYAGVYNAVKDLTDEVQVTKIFGAGYEGFDTTNGSEGTREHNATTILQIAGGGATLCK